MDDEGAEFDFITLYHYETEDRAGPIPDAPFRIVGCFSNADRLEAAVRSLRTKPGFRQWPNGFRHTLEFSDHVASIPGGLTGPVDDYEQDFREDDFDWPDPVLTLYQLVQVRTAAPPARPGILPPRADLWLVGYYTTLSLAEAVIGWVKDDPEVSPWPDGFRIIERPLDEVAFPDGYDPATP